MKKIFLFILIISPLFSQTRLDKKYNEAIDLYNKDSYKASKVIIEDLISNNYQSQNPYIYFVLGKIYRQPETYNHDKAISNLKEYIDYRRTTEELARTVTNRMYASINLAYEYLKVWNRKNIDLAKKTLNNYDRDSAFREHQDFTYCYATVFNSSGFLILDLGEVTEVKKEFYLPAVEDFKKALDKRPELDLIANNLAITYIRIIELIQDTTNPERKNYIKLANDVLNDDRYKNKRRFEDTRAYFYEKICPSCKKNS